jgi:mono/diheme cytochrome c family protein
MTINRIKFAALIVFGFAVLVVFGFRSVPTHVLADNDQDAAAIYKAKCAACHGKAAEKFYKSDMTDEEQVQAILKGKKAAKPPHMPGFGSKGVTEDNAKALVAYMKGLKTPAQ